MLEKQNTPNAPIELKFKTEPGTTIMAIPLPFSTEARTWSIQWRHTERSTSGPVIPETWSKASNATIIIHFWMAKDRKHTICSLVTTYSFKDSQCSGIFPPIIISITQTLELGPSESEKATLSGTILCFLRSERFL